MKNDQNWLPWESEMPVVVDFPAVVVRKFKSEDVTKKSRIKETGEETEMFLAQSPNGPCRRFSCKGDMLTRLRELNLHAGMILKIRAKETAMLKFEDGVPKGYEYVYYVQEMYFLRDLNAAAPAQAATTAPQKMAKEEDDNKNMAKTSDSKMISADMFLKSSLGTKHFG